MSTHHAPDEALAAVRRSREAVADRLQYPRWYTPAYALGAGLLIGTIALPSPLDSSASCLLAVALMLSHRYWSDRKGVAVSGLTPSRARPVMLALGALLIVLAGASFVLNARVAWWWPLALAPAAALGAGVAHAQWLRIYRRELAEGA